MQALLLYKKSDKCQEKVFSATDMIMPAVIFTAGKRVFPYENKIFAQTS